jgi:hypothetical protein
MRVLKQRHDLNFFRSLGINDWMGKLDNFNGHGT